MVSFSLGLVNSQHYPEFQPELRDHLPKGLEMDTLVILEFQITGKGGNVNVHPDHLAIFQRPSLLGGEELSRKEHCTQSWRLRFSHHSLESSLDCNTAL